MRRQAYVHTEKAEESAGVARPEISVFEAFYAEQIGPMLRLAHIITGSNAIAEEVAQEAFLRVHERWAELLVPAAYLRTAVTNLCRSHLRRLRTERRVLPPRVELVGSPEIDETWAAVLRLPFRMRAVLALRYYADLTEPEIARVLECRLGTVKSSHHRALARLRRELS